MVAFVGAVRADLQQSLLAAQRAALQSDSDTPPSRASRPCGTGRAGLRQRRLRPRRGAAARHPQRRPSLRQRPHAQRDLIDLSLLEAAVRSGDEPLAAALAAKHLAQCLAASHRVLD
jgi:hypothetical protein